jgi:hypothetical protein
MRLRSTIRMALIIVNCMFAVLFFLIFMSSNILLFINEPHKIGSLLEIVPDHLSQDQLKSKNQFYKEAEERGLQLPDVPILKTGSTIFLFNRLLPKFDFGSTNAEGVCLRLNSPKVIVIQDNATMSVIFHELGHCLLGRSHDNSLLSEGFPKSLMYDTSEFFMDDRSIFLNNYKYYVDELFSIKNSN